MTKDEFIEKWKYESIALFENLDADLTSYSKKIWEQACKAMMDSISSNIEGMITPTGIKIFSLSKVENRVLQGVADAVKEFTIPEYKP